MIAKQKFASIKTAYLNAKIIAGENAGQFNRSLVLYALAYSVQGIAYLCVFNVMRALFASPVDSGSAWLWFGVMVLCFVVNVVACWFAYDFDYSETRTEISHNLRVKLGLKLKTMPLEAFNRYKTGDLNSSLSSNVEESLMMLGIVSGLLMEVILTPTVAVIGMFFID